jgi:hypothetical protein
VILCRPMQGRRAVQNAPGVGTVDVAGRDPLPGVPRAQMLEARPQIEEVVLRRLEARPHLCEQRLLGGDRDDHLEPERLRDFVARVPDRMRAAGRPGLGCGGQDVADGAVALQVAHLDVGLVVGQAEIERQLAALLETA